ncbi:MAG TPA: MlaD family protein [Solirubrobacteraceae bacterium]|jgi:phospholipid/cholesterol/gamma-HCH transport system substrate-binding protein|nr:MlaD family protein [Solirubrobacteraceae bacterium]
MSPPEMKGHEGGLSVRDQIDRYRTAFIAVLTMVLLAAVTGGYILAHENLKLPGWVPVLGREYFTLKAEFQTAQAVTPGQGQAVTIAGAKIGEIARVDLNQGVAVVTMNVTPKYAHLYRNATLLLRPKTQLQDITVEVNPGTPEAGRLRSGQLIPLSQTAPNINFDEFLAGLDAETRAYLQELLAGLGQGLKNNGTALAATLKRFSPTARLIQQIAQQLEIRHANTARSIHNFRLLVEALGGKDKQLAELVDSSNAVFKTFAAEDANVQRTLRLLPGALHKTGVGLAKLATATNVLGPTLHKLQPFASSLKPAQEATRKLANETTPVLKNEIRPFARQILPVVNQLGPSTQQLAESFPKLQASFSVLTEFFNELAANPGPNKGSFLFFLAWANHNLNSVVSSADAHGPVGRSVIYFNCEVLGILKGVQEVNPTVNLLINLLRPPTKQECVSQGIIKGVAASASAARRSAGGKPAAGAVFSGLAQQPFSGGQAAAHGGGR